MDLCVTVSFCEQAKLLWHKTHDIYPQKRGINCYHPHFLMERILIFGYNSPEPQSVLGRGLRCHVRAWQGMMVGQGVQCSDGLHPAVASGWRELNYVLTEVVFIP